MKIKIHLLQLIFSVSIICTNTNPLQGDANSIVPANPNEFPFVVSLASAPANLATQHFCGGTLISKSYILTAWHCFVNITTQLPYRNITDITVTIGSNDMTMGRKYGITYWLSYVEWSMMKTNKVDDIYHDLAIAKLTEDVNDIASAVISQCTQKQVRGRNVMTAGWGIVNDGVDPKFLQKASLHVISRKKCRFNFVNTDAPPFMIINHLCTVHRPPVVLGCGDSGSPLVTNGNELIAVNEGVCANDIEHPLEQNSHQSVEYYREFITEFAEISVPCKSDH